MPIDPNIALSYRPPQLAPLQIQTPLEGLARIVSLRSLMQEGQLKTLELQKMQQQMREQQSLADLFRNASETGAAGPATDAPPAGAAGAAPGPAPDDSEALATPEAQVAPAPAGPRLAGGGPVTLIPGIPGASAPPIGIAGPIQPAFPSAAQILRAAPLTGMGVLKGLTEAQKAQLELHIKQLEDQKGRTERMSSLATGVIDDDSLKASLAAAVKDNLIHPDDARRYFDLGFGHPTTQNWLRSVQLQAVGADKAQEMMLARAKAARDELMFGPQYVEQQAKAIKEGTQARTGQIQAASNILTAARAGSDEQYAAALDKYKDNPDIQVLFGNAKTPKDVATAALTADQYVTTQETAKQNRIQNAQNLVRTYYEGQRNQREGEQFQQMYGPDANENLRGVEKGLRGPATREATKAGDEWRKKMEAADQMESLIALARAGNKAAGSNLPLVGVETLNAINGIKRINREELHMYGSAGSLYDNIVGRLDKLASGQPIPEDLMKDIQQMHQTLRQNADKSYDDALDNVNQNYGSNFRRIKPPMTSSAAPRAGDVIEGKDGIRYRFKGGDPKDKKNYQPL